MKAEFNDKGVLTITPENKTEDLCLSIWHKETGHMEERACINFKKFNQS